MSLSAELHRRAALAARRTTKAARAGEPVGDDPRRLHAELAIPGANADRHDSSVTGHVAKYRRSSSDALLAFAAVTLTLLALVLALVDVSGRADAYVQTVAALAALAGCGFLLGWLLRGGRA